ncbi:MAG: sigma-70 family RNA polymerase sigma factor [Bacillota bacterium]|nr:sigma-70 family RNA polymerase sigma factor [Bacillota bacterium]MDW7684919.1 sigma-70 family RNA polymerase sigma factor [Bacillota bacterium]
MTENEFLQLLQPLEAYLARMAHAIVGDREEAKDALQDALLSAFVTRNQLRDTAYFKPWIKKIVAHQCGRQLKKKGRVIPMGSAAEMTPDSSAGNQHDGLIWDVVQTLPEHQSRVITLRYMADLKQTEIAAVLNIPEGTVKSRIHKALVSLRKILGEEMEAGLSEMPRY